MLPLIASAVTSIGGAVAGAITSATQRKKEQKAIRKEKETLEDWYKREMATDYLDSSEARQTLSLLRKKNKNDMERTNNSLVKQGLTDEARVAYASGINQNYGDSVSRISAMDTAYKNNINNKYDSQLREINREERRLNNKVDTDQIGNVISSAGNGLMEMYGAGVFNKKKNN